MSRSLRPVLLVPDPAAALDWFATLPGMIVDHATGEAISGDLRLVVLPTGERPPSFQDIPFDHLALRVGDVDATFAALLAGGAAPDPAFTPDGPREIAAFWQTGVRYAFVMGPGGVPVELCARRGTTGPAAVLGLDHLGLRVRDTAETAARLVARGGVEVARHLLPAPDRPVDVRFLQEANLMWEVFDEDPLPRAPGPGHWVGVLG